ncbi:hypothetical protein QF046_000380 [Microbacterium sp. W4I4]|nr:hypothetical protein [Microbacterium sp. W4I4]
MSKPVRVRTAVATASRTVCAVGAAPALTTASGSAVKDGRCTREKADAEPL